MLLDDEAWLSSFQSGFDGTEDLDLHLLLRLDCLGTHVRQEDAVVHLDQTFVDLGLGRVDVETGTGEFAGVESVDESFLVDDTTTSGVDEDGAVLHLLELGLAERLFGLLVEGKVERDDVGLGEQLLLRLDVSPRGVCVGVGVTVVVDDLHVEGSGTLGKCGTDTAHADDAESLSFRVVGRLETGLPLASTSVDLGTVVLTQAGEDKEHSCVGGSIVNSGRGVRNSNALGLGSVNVDLVISGTIVADGFERGRKLVDKLSVEHANLVCRVVVTVNGNNVGVLAASSTGLEELGS